MIDCSCVSILRSGIRSGTWWEWHWAFPICNTIAFICYIMLYLLFVEFTWNFVHFISLDALCTVQLNKGWCSTGSPWVAWGYGHFSSVYCQVVCFILSWGGPELDCAGLISHVSNNDWLMNTLTDEFWKKQYCRGPHLIKKIILGSHPPPTKHR